MIGKQMRAAMLHAQGSCTVTSCMMKGCCGGFRVSAPPLAIESVTSLRHFQTHRPSHMTPTHTSYKLVITLEPSVLQQPHRACSCRLMRDRTFERRCTGSQLTIRESVALQTSCIASKGGIYPEHQTRSIQETLSIPRHPSSWPSIT